VRNEPLVFQSRIYFGSSDRIGSHQSNKIKYSGSIAAIASITLPLLLQKQQDRLLGYRLMGKKTYEIKDHLGNLRSTFTDVILSTVNPTTFAITDIKADAKSMYNYYAFGSPKPNTYNATLVTTANDEWFEDGGYRYGFNGQEKVDEIAGVGNHNTALFWEYDTRLGRRWNVDPVVKEYESGYSCFGNDPILNIDDLGDAYTVTNESKDGKLTKSTISAVIYIQGTLDPKALNKRAAELTKAAKKEFVNKKVAGVEICFNIEYKYDASKNANNLNGNENLMTFEKPELLISPKGNTVLGYTDGFSGVAGQINPNTGSTSHVGSSGKNNSTVFHESGHLIGFDERYKNGDDLVGYENSVMGISPKGSKLVLKQYYHVLSRVSQLYNSGINSITTKNYLDHKFKMEKNISKDIGVNYDNIPK
jgi:hypothetical protein